MMKSNAEAIKQAKLKIETKLNLEFEEKRLEEVEKALELYSKNKIVKYLGQVKSGKWVDGDNKGKSI